MFLYEGETEKEFYDQIFDKFLERSKINTNFGGLNGIYDLNNKVESKIKTYLGNSKYSDRHKIHVFVAYDREGDRNTETLLNTKELVSNFKVGDVDSRIASLNEIVATQDLESWLFHDLANIYSFLKVPKSKRNMKAYLNCEAVNNRTLSALFHRYGKHYQNGKRAGNFISSLDLEIIFNKGYTCNKGYIVKDRTWHSSLMKIY